MSNDDDFYRTRERERRTFAQRRHTVKIFVYMAIIVAIASYAAFALLAVTVRP